MALPVIGALGKAIWASLAGFTLYSGTKFAVSILSGLGIFFIAKTGLDYAEMMLRSMVDSSLSGVPSDAVQFVFMAGIYEAISIMIAAFSARVTLNAMSRIAFRKPG